MLRFKFTKLIAITILVFSLSSCIKETHSFFRETITFQEATLAPETYWNGEDGTGSKIFGSVSFYNKFEENESSGYWKGFAYSNITDIETPGPENQYSAYISEGGYAGNVYSVVHVDGESATMSFMNEGSPISILITNSTFSYFSMKNGNGSIDPFEDGDWFMLTISGYNINNEPIDSVEFYLADYREGKTKIIDEWKQVNLNSLSGSTKIIFTLSSSISDEFGLNIPAYFCIDNFEISYTE